MVKTSLNSLLPKDLSGSTRSNSTLAPHFTCSACPPSKIVHHLEQSAHMARLPANLAHLSPDSPPSPTMSRFMKPTSYEVLTLPRNIIFNEQF
ncbi:hypothetical protein AMECASPLE_028742 [Ameca splendens]|uniref:Uncharacterized protein n=1 Tax=Ameca splendens TaxID=208324 RepID=A0ABV0YSN4_9TELE